jgi:hypothetical protein
MLETASDLLPDIFSYLFIQHRKEKIAAFMESLENLVMFELIYCLHFAAGKASEKEAFARLKKRSPFYLTANFQFGTEINKNFFRKSGVMP